MVLDPFTLAGGVAGLLSSLLTIGAYGFKVRDGWTAAPKQLRRFHREVMQFAQLWRAVDIYVSDLRHRRRVSPPIWRAFQDFTQETVEILQEAKAEVATFCRKEKKISKFQLKWWAPVAILFGYPKLRRRDRLRAYMNRDSIENCRSSLETAIASLDIWLYILEHCGESISGEGLEEVQRRQNRYARSKTQLRGARRKYNRQRQDLCLWDNVLESSKHHSSKADKMVHEYASRISLPDDHDANEQVSRGDLPASSRMQNSAITMQRPLESVRRSSNRNEDMVHTDSSQLRRRGRTRHRSAETPTPRAVPSHKSVSELSIKQSLGPLNVDARRLQSENLSLRHQLFMQASQHQTAIERDVLAFKDMERQVVALRDESAERAGRIEYLQSHNEALENVNANLQKENEALRSSSRESSQHRSDSGYGSEAGHDYMGPPVAYNNRAQHGRGKKF